MAVYIFKDVSVIVNSVDLSDHVSSVTLKTDYEVKEYQGMSHNSKKRICGVYEWSVEVAFYQNTAASKVDQTLRALVGAASFAIAVKPTSGAKATTNPSYEGNVILPSYAPLSGSHGDLAETTVTFLSDGDLTIDVTP